MKYIHNILEQYKKDGLSSQRYSRTTQEGLGSDILAGISTTVTALYRDIYGVRPKWNRMGLEPNMIDELNGTSFTYNLRDTLYHLKLNVNDYEMSTENFSIRCSNSFGASWKGNKLFYYPDNIDNIVFSIDAKSKPVHLKMDTSAENDFSWKITSKGNHQFRIAGLNKNATYELTVNHQPLVYARGEDGVISFSYKCDTETRFRVYSPQ
jgi:hypothetical protein